MKPAAGRSPRAGRRAMRLLVSLAAVAVGAAACRAAEPFDLRAVPPGRRIEASYFGTHLHRLGGPEGRFPATPWPAGDVVGALRLWDSGTRWADLEPAPGRFDFRRLDAYVAEAERHGARLLLVLGSPPRWAAARPDEPGPYGPGSASEPASLAAWDRYVGAIASRYRGRIGQYELWNEPYFSDFPEDRDQPAAFYSGSAATLVALGRRARAVLDAEDPRAQLLSPGFVGAVKRLDLFLARGGATSVDAIAYHFYAEDDREFVDLAMQVRAVMRQRGVASLPLVNTESGFALRGVQGAPAVPGLPPIDRRSAAAHLARTMVLGAFLGLDGFYQYAWDNGRMGMVGSDGLGTTDSLAAYRSVVRWLRGTRLDACRLWTGRTVVCEGERDGRRLSIAWQADSGHGELDAQALAAGGNLEDAIASTAPTSIGSVPVAWWSAQPPVLVPGRPGAAAR